jgi:hypothetical protein
VVCIRLGSCSRFHVVGRRLSVSGEPQPFMHRLRRTRRSGSLPRIIHSYTGNFPQTTQQFTPAAPYNSWFTLHGLHQMRTGASLVAPVTLKRRYHPERWKVSKRLQRLIAFFSTREGTMRVQRDAQNTPRSAGGYDDALSPMPKTFGLSPPGLNHLTLFIPLYPGMQPLSTTPVCGAGYQVPGDGHRTYCGG